MRKMATIRKIDAVTAIPNADAIELAHVGGWRVVIKKGEFAARDLAVYCEIDSWLPYELAPFLSKGSEPREYMGIKGERLRTIKLRGQVSQGLLLPRYAVLDIVGEIYEGMDVTEILGIVKYDPPVPAHLAGEVRGTFPSWIKKTDQERVQNLTQKITEWVAQGLSWEVTEKLDGSSMTVYIHNGDEGVCSRNLDLKETETNSYWMVARREGLLDKIRSTGRNLALQGELIGEGIQGNPYKIKGQDFRLFDIYDIGNSQYLAPWEREAMASRLGIKTVPVIEWTVKLLDTLGIATVEQMLVFAEGKSKLLDSVEREGLVFKCHEQAVSFKAISNRFLLKNGD